MTLNAVFQGLSVSLPVSLENTEVGRVVNDSRAAAAATLFVAASGYGKDPHEYIASAYQAGCRYFAVDASRPENLDGDFPGAVFIRVEQIARDYGMIAENAFQNPSKSVTVLGITGTSGKNNNCLCRVSGASFDGGAGRTDRDR